MRLRMLDRAATAVAMPVPHIDIEAALAGRFLLMIAPGHASTNRGSIEIICEQDQRTAQAFDLYMVPNCPFLEGSNEARNVRPLAEALQGGDDRGEVITLIRFDEPDLDEPGDGIPLDFDQKSQQRARRHCVAVHEVRVGAGRLAAFRKRIRYRSGVAEVLDSQPASVIARSQPIAGRRTQGRGTAPIPPVVGGGAA